MKQPPLISQERALIAVALENVLREVGFLRVIASELPASSDESEGAIPRADYRLELKERNRFGDNAPSLWVELKYIHSGEPGYIRRAIKTANHKINREADIIVLGAPYIPPHSQAICREHEIGYVDLVGNVRVVKQPLFIERRSDERPQADRKQMNSIFSTKSARVVRALLKDPYRRWTVSELADVAKISMGQVSNVKAWLLEHEQITVL
jgi:hypothetical protein